jgi:hypothetical protein
LACTNSTEASPSDASRSFWTTISWQVRNTTVQVWTVGEGFGIGSEFRQTGCAANNFRGHKVLFCWFKCPSRSPSGFAIHWGERTEPSARSPSVLAYYVTLTSMAFDLAIGVVGRCTFSTPSRKSAVTFLLSASSGSVKLRRKLPNDRSVRWNFLF